jgi:hypothetical protein
MANDVTPMIPVDDERDEQIFAQWEQGKGLRTLAREFGMPVAQIEQAVDRVLPSFGPASQLRSYKRELERLESLSSDFYALAKKDKNPEHAHLVARLNERICAMRGISAINVRMDPYVTEVAQQPTQFEKIKEAIERICDSQPPAEREAHNLIRKVGGEKAVALLRGALGNGNGAANGDGSGGDLSSGLGDAPSAPDRPDGGSSKRDNVG